MSLRDEVYMATSRLVDTLDSCDDAGLERIRSDISEYMRISAYLTSRIDENAHGRVVSKYARGNVLVHKLTGVKHVVREREFEDEFDVYEFVSEFPHGDGKYNYLCGDPKCKCVRHVG